jgi:hypothetical protein
MGGEPTRIACGIKFAIKAEKARKNDLVKV